MKCPNINTKEFKSLEAKVGSIGAHHLFNQFDEDYEAIDKFLENKSSNNVVEELSADMQNVFKGEQTTTVKEALEIIANDDVNQVTKLLAKRLLRNLSNDTKINLASLKELQEIKGTEKNIGGVYDSGTNIISVRPDMSHRVLLHEILHAYTYHELRNNSEAKDALGNIYSYLKRNHRKYPELVGEYAMSDLDEFLVGIFTAPKFMAKLQNIPAQFSTTATVWDEVMDILAQVLEYLGFSKKKSISILEESMDAAIKIIETATAKVHDRSDEAFNLDEIEENYGDILASLTDEEQDFYKAQSMNTVQQDVVNKILSVQDIELTPKGDYYINKAKTLFRRVSSVLNNGFADTGEYEINTLIGTDIDNLLSDIILGKTYAQTFGSSRIDKVKKQTYDYFKSFVADVTKDGSVLMTQQIFSNEFSNVAGAVDVLVVKPDGKLVIYDLKTSTSKTTGPYKKTSKAGHEYTVNYNTPYSAGQKSKRQVHTEQQSMYKRMAELLGFDVEAINILPIHIEIDTTNKEVTSVNPEPVISLTYDQALAENHVPFVNAKMESLRKESKRSIEHEDKALADIKDRLNRIQKVLAENQRDATTASAVDKLAKLNDKIKDLSAMEAIQEYIKSANEVALEYYALMEEIVKNPDDLTQVGNLAFINKFVGVFDNLKELQLTMFLNDQASDIEAIKTYYEERAKAVSNGTLDMFEEDNLEPINTTQTLDKTVKIFEAIKTQYVEHGRVMLAKRLFSEYSDEEVETRTKLKADILKRNPKDAYGLSLATTWEELAEQMTTASRDISSYERWLTSTIGGTTNDFIALLARMIDSNQMGVSDRLRYYEEKLGGAYNKYAKTSSASKDRVAKFNEPFIEEVTETLEDGTTHTYKQLISEYDYAKYSAVESKFYKDHKDLKHVDIKAFRAKQREFYKNNTKPAPNAEATIAARKAELTDYQYKQWAKKSFSDYNGVRTYYKELSVPNDSYKSSKFSSLTGPQLEYYNTLKEVHEELKLLLPKHKAEELGNKIPAIYKGDWEFAQEGKVKKVIQDSFKFNDSDTAYGLVDLDGNSHKEVPFFYLNKIGAEQTSSDLLQSYMLAAKQWSMSNAKLKIQAEVEIIRNLTSYDNNVVDKLKVDKTNAKGINQIDPASLLKKVLKKEGETNIQNKIQEVIDDMFYGIKDQASIVSIPLIGDVSLDKGTNTLLKWSALTALPFNIPSGVTNAAMGALNNLIESVAGEHLDVKDLAKGTATYFKYLPQFIADRNKVGGKHWMTKVVEDFDLLHDHYINNFGEKVSGTAARKLATTSSLMFLQTGPEHQIGISNGLAHLNAIKFFNGKFIGKQAFFSEGGKESDWKSATSLLQALEEGQGELKGAYANAWSIKDRQVVKNRVKEINKYVQGNYATSNKTALARRWYGKLVEFFRKYVVSGFARRLGKQRYNHATQTVMEGSYVSVYNMFKEIYQDMKTMGFKEAFDKSLSPTRKANLKRLIAELTAFILVFAAVTALTPDDDEEKNTYAENMVLLILRRMQSEITFYANPNETWRMLKNPSIGMNTVDSLVGLFGGLIFVWGEDAHYKRKSGIWEKGDSKDIAHLIKVMPIFKGIVTSRTPEEQLKVFNK
jgi:hypothetical protein